MQNKKLSILEILWNCKHLNNIKILKIKTKIQTIILTTSY